jgi:hypothetical protein
MGANPREGGAVAARQASLSVLFCLCSIHKPDKLGQGQSSPVRLSQTRFTSHTWSYPVSSRPIQSWLVKPNQASTGSARFTLLLADYGKRSIFAADRPYWPHGISDAKNIL